MNFFKSLKTKLIIQISLLVIISTVFVLIFVNLVTQQKPNKDPIPVTVDTSLSWSQQRAQIQAQIQESIQEERKENALRLLTASLIGIFFQVIFTSAGTYLLIRKELKPLADLNKTMEDINEKLLYLQINATEDTSEELAHLIGNFNKMMARLDKAFKSQRQFVENVSHEVKTPLTVIRTNLESIILDKHISKSDLDEAMHSSIDSINFLNNLVEDLMLLSFLDKADIKKEDIDLKVLCEDIIEELNTSAKANEINLKFDVGVDKKYLVSASEILLKRAVSNLVENAIKYSYKKSDVVIALNDNGNNIELYITNTGEQISDEFKDKIFDRFFRIDKSRSRSTGGFGLGLAITKEIIEAFGGKIAVNTKKDTNTFTISLLTQN